MIRKVLKCIRRRLSLHVLPPLGCSVLTTARDEAASDHTSIRSRRAHEPKTRGLNKPSPPSTHRARSVPVCIRADRGTVDGHHPPDRGPSTCLIPAAPAPPRSRRGVTPPAESTPLRGGRLRPAADMVSSIQLNTTLLIRAIWRVFCYAIGICRILFSFTT